MEMKLNKVRGVDGIYAELLRYASHEIVVILIMLINECAFCMHGFLKDLGTNIICFVPNKTNVTRLFNQYFKTLNRGTDVLY